MKGERGVEWGHMEREEKEAGHVEGKGSRGHMVYKVGGGEL